jgi:aminoglycoside 6'-N-acetyltransferase I
MIKKAAINDAITLAILSSKLWQAHSIEELENEFEEMLLNNDNACFIKVIDSNPVAFAHCATRHEYVEGTNSSQVG